MFHTQDRTDLGTMPLYFSNREAGFPARTKLEVEAPAWGGIVALVHRYESNGGFGIDFPESCPDGRGPIGTDSHTLGLAIQADIPEIAWPLDAKNAPPTLRVMDLIEFCHAHVAEPIEGSYHSYFGHSHLSFDRANGQADFRNRVNMILARNKLAYALGETGQVTRLAAPILDEELRAFDFETGDATLDILLDAARAKFLNPDPTIRREALEKIWDAWERLKTLEPGRGKKESATALLDKAADEPQLRKVLEDESKTLTAVGNQFRIRHSETTQVEIRSADQVDYLFHRMLALVLLLLRAR
jgi:hypothetical protein